MDDGIQVRRMSPDDIDAVCLVLGCESAGVNELNALTTTITLEPDIDKGGDHPQIR